METTELTKGYLRRMFGERVQVEYYDMALPDQYEQHKVLLEQVPQGYLYYPMVFVNDELKVTAGADPYQVMYVVQEVLQAEKATSQQATA